MWRSRNDEVPLCEVLPPPTPELNKEAACRDEARVIGQFVEWMEKFYATELEGAPDLPAVEKMLYAYFEVDADKCEGERRKLLMYQRMLNTRAEGMAELGIGDGR